MIPPATNVPQARALAVALVYTKLLTQGVERARTFYAEETGVVAFGCHYHEL